MEEDVGIDEDVGIEHDAECVEEGKEILAIAASLDVQDYLQRDNDGLMESVFLSLRSDIFQNPHVQGYNMLIPPANHCEAMQ